MWCESKHNWEENRIPSAFLLICALVRAVIQITPATVANGLWNTNSSSVTASLNQLLTNPWNINHDSTHSYLKYQATGNYGEFQIAIMILQSSLINWSWWQAKLSLPTSHFLMSLIFHWFAHGHGLLIPSLYLHPFFLSPRTFLPWRWTQHIPPKHSYPFMKLHSPTYQKSNFQFFLNSQTVAAND